MTMTKDEYLQHPGINQSKLKTLAQSPELYHGLYVSKTIKPKPPSAAMNFGIAVENYLRTGNHGFIQLPPDIKARRGKDYEAWKATIDPALQVIPKGEWDELRLDDLEKVGQKVKEHPRASQLIAEGEWHRRIVWERSGIRCKAELDLVWRSSLICDVKTAADNTPEGFARQAINLGYDIQAAWYSDGWEVLAGTALPFVFIVIKNTEPYNVETFTLSESFLHRGMTRAVQLLLDLQRREELNDWHTSTHGTIATIEPPRWAQTQETFSWG